MRPIGRTQHKATWTKRGPGLRFHGGEEGAGRPGARNWRPSDGRGSAGGDSCEGVFSSAERTDGRCSHFLGPQKSGLGGGRLSLGDAVLRTPWGIWEVRIGLMNGDAELRARRPVGFPGLDCSSLSFTHVATVIYFKTSRN